MIKILLADNQTLTQAGIITLLTGLTGAELIGVATNLEQLIDLSHRQKPNVIIVDPYYDDIFSAEVLTDNQTQFNNAKILALSNILSIREIADFTKAVKCNYISKLCSSVELIAAVYATAKGESYFCARISDVLSRNNHLDLTGATLPTLTVRESEIIQMIGEGLTNKEIAERLFLSFHTIKSHRKNIIKKLGFTFKNAGELSLLIKSLG